MHFVFIVVAMFVSVSICISSFEALYSCAPKNENRFIISAFTKKSKESSYFLNLR